MSKPTVYHGERWQAKCKYYEDERIKDMREHPYGNPNDEMIPIFDNLTKQMNVPLKDKRKEYDNLFWKHYHFCLLDVVCRYDKGLRDKTCRDIGPLDKWGDKDCDHCKYGCYAVVDANNELVVAESNRRMFWNEMD